MNIDISKLDHSFIKKPLLIGGKAMEYYGLREGNDIDFVVAAEDAEDYDALAKQHPDHTKELFGDFGVVLENLEVWKSICLFDYDYLKAAAVDLKDYLVISLENFCCLRHWE